MNKPFKIGDFVAIHDPGQCFGTRVEVAISMGSTKYFYGWHDRARLMGASGTIKNIDGRVALVDIGEKEILIDPKGLTLVIKDPFWEIK